LPQLTDAGRNTVTEPTDTIPPSQLPGLIRNYLLAHQARELDAAVGCYAEDATVVDEGNIYRGPQQIRDWLDTSASEYTYTIELTGARRIDDEHYVAIHHLEGNFPGGLVDLQYKFTLREGCISQLTIEP
jgi:ketosteroid isomerase-like protein